MSQVLQMESGDDSVVRWSSRSDSPGWIVAENGCHVWTGSTRGKGYGGVRIDGRTEFVHRVRYEREVGPIPEGMQLDHVCNNRLCCNPAHLRPVTNRENTLRGETITAAQRAQTHCKHGHELAGENLEPGALRRGVRQCRACRRRAS